MSSDIEKILRMGNYDAPPPQWHTEADIAHLNTGPAAAFAVAEFLRPSDAE
ncbi:hypothetical protein GS504_03385 [Rhodococcus hoagii]|nr:hypothetical protein [Prescottella equi]NKS56599.1 hypothetical protein [Prescottella equi]